MKEVYIIMSPSGGISLDISTSKGTCYEDLEVAEKELEATNRWSRNKGYGVYELVTLKVVETEKTDVIKYGNKVIYEGKEYYYMGFSDNMHVLGDRFLRAMIGVGNGDLIRKA
jgi:hypothetical protein